MTRVQSDISAETRRIKLKGKLQMNAWCWLFMAMAVGFYILFQGYPDLRQLLNESVPEHPVF